MKRLMNQVWIKLVVVAASATFVANVEAGGHGGGASHGGGSNRGGGFSGGSSRSAGGSRMASGSTARRIAPVSRPSGNSGSVQKALNPTGRPTGSGGLNPTGRPSRAGGLRPANPEQRLIPVNPGQSGGLRPANPGRPVLNPGQGRHPVTPGRPIRPVNPGHVVANPGTGLHEQPPSVNHPIDGLRPGRPSRPRPVRPGRPGRPVRPQPTCPGDHCDHCPGFWVGLPIGADCSEGDVIEVTEVTEITEVIEQPAAVVEAAPVIDLELLEVELVDEGNLAAKTGPTYRVFLRSNSNVAITQGFDIGLVATNGQEPGKKSPFKVERIEAVEAGEEFDVDITLPAAVNRMHKDASGKAEPFTTLFVAVDARQEVTESSELNNTNKLSRTEVPAASDDEDDDEDGDDAPEVAANN